MDGPDVSDRSEPFCGARWVPQYYWVFVRLRLLERTQMIFHSGLSERRSDVAEFSATRRRHSLATLLMDEGENPAVVQAIMRHAKLGMTLYYSQSRRKQKTRSARESAATFAAPTFWIFGIPFPELSCAEDLTPNRGG
jgi:integrase